MMYPKKSPSRATMLVVAPALIVLSLLFAGCTPVNNSNGNSSSAASAGPSVVYFGNTVLNPNAECSSVYPVTRVISGESDHAVALMRELLGGPDADEKEDGYTSFFSEDTRDALKSLTIEKGTAYVNLVDLRFVIPNASSSCGSAAMLAEIESTLTQLPGIDRVILAFDGDVELFYNWIQIGCGESNDYCNNVMFQSGQGE